MEQENQKLRRLTIGLKIAAAYLVLSGGVGLIWPLLGLGPDHPDVQSKGLASRIGSHSWNIIFHSLYLVSGIGLLLRKGWGRRTALYMIVFGTMYTTGSFAWVFAEGKPTMAFYGISFAVVGLWHAILFYLVFKNSAAEAHPQTEPVQQQHSSDARN